MPTYEYQCEKCGDGFEKRQNMSDDPLRECPTCGGTLKRLIGSGAGVIFKGAGFHATDYPSSGDTATCDRASPCCGRTTPCASSPRAS